MPVKEAIIYFLFSMEYLIILILIGVALYYAFKWQAPKRKSEQSSGNDSNPYQSGSNNSGDGNNDSGPYNSQGSVNPGLRGGSSYAKWIGGGLGWAFGGPIGGILGFVFGSMVGGMSSGKYEYGKTQGGDFNISLLILTAAVMKVDGTVKRSELDFAKRFFATQFGSDKSAEYVRLLGEILKQNIDVPAVTQQIRQYMDYSSKLLLLQYLFGVALADGKYHPSEVDLIQSISGYLGVDRKEFDSIKAMFIKEADSAYKILEIDPSSSNEDVKKAYREMAKKYHPDKVNHLGEEVKKAAEEKFTKLNAAYETVKQERGMN
jgi:DnaJ like chaperone protein